MPMIHERNKIILTGDTAKRFNALASKPSSEVIERRNDYYREIENTIKVEKRGRTIRITTK